MWCVPGVHNLHTATTGTLAWCTYSEQPPHRKVLRFRSIKVPSYTWKNEEHWPMKGPLRYSFIQSNCCVIPGCCSFGIGKGSSVIYQTQKVHLPPMQLPSYSILCASFSASMINVTSTESHRDVNCGHCCWWQAQAVWRWNKLKSRADKSSAHALTIYRHNDNKLESRTSLRASILWLE